MEENTESEFKEYAELVTRLKGEPSNDEKLKLYGLYKQSTVGDINITQPWAIQAVARAKWSSWNNYKGLSQEESKLKYINQCKRLIKKYTLKC